MPKTKHTKDKNLKDAHNKHNLRKFSHYAQCTKTLGDEPKMGMWGSKKGLKTLALVLKHWERKNHQKEHNRKIQKKQTLIDHKILWSITTNRSQVEF